MLNRSLLALTLCGALIAPSTVLGADIFFAGRYENSAYDYSITVPPGFAFESPIENRGVGAGFVHEGGDARLDIWATDDPVNNLEARADALVDKWRAQGWMMTPATAEDGGWSAEGQLDDNLIALRLIGLCPDSYAAYELTYPAAMEPAYRPAIAEMDASFTPTQDIECID